MPGTIKTITSDQAATCADLYDFNKQVSRIAGAENWPSRLTLGSTSPQSISPSSQYFKGWGLNKKLI